jgi:hypothetical protein
MVRRVQRVLIIVAHPDDAESWAGGTIAKLVRDGAQVAYCVATNGDKGSGDRSMTPERLASRPWSSSAFRTARSRTRGRRGWPSRRRSDGTVRISSSLRTRTGPNYSAPLTAITASWARSHWIASIRSLVPPGFPGVARPGA